MSGSAPFPIAYGRSNPYVAMVAILVLAIVIDLVWKRTHGTAPSLPAGVAAAAKGT